jgi:hypothetical protein
MTACFHTNFVSSYIAENPEELVVEMAGSEEALKVNWEWSKFANDLIHKLLAIRERDGRLHPLLVLYAQREGRMMEVTEEEHKQMLETIWVGGDRFMIPPEWRQLWACILMLGMFRVQVDS